MSNSSSIEVGVTESGHLTADDEGELWNDFKKSKSRIARERLFSGHLAFARKVARRFHRERSWGDIELTDLYQYAYAGLLEALDRFDPGRGIPFRPFAVRRISGSIRDGIAHMSEMREQLSWRRRMRRERTQSLLESREPGTAIEKLAELAMGLALSFMLEGTGLVDEAAREHDQTRVHDTAYDTLVWRQTLAHLQRELAFLPEREQTILRQHYFHELSFDQLAALLAISKARVSQLHRAALMNLRKRMRAQGHFRMEP